MRSLEESDLTLHRRACGLCEEWNKQEIDEVEEGQDIVPEQASCRNKDTSTDSIVRLQTTFKSSRTNKKMQLNISKASGYLSLHHIYCITLHF